MQRLDPQKVEKVINEEAELRTPARCEYCICYSVLLRIRTCEISQWGFKRDDTLRWRTGQRREGGGAIRVITFMYVGFLGNAIVGNKQLKLVACAFNILTHIMHTSGGSHLCVYYRNETNNAVPVSSLDYRFHGILIFPF